MSGDLGWPSSTAYTPADYTWAEFKRSFDAACLDAWEEYWRHPDRALSPDPTITLPHSVFPHVAAMVSPTTGKEIPITRISPFDWGEGMSDPRQLVDAYAAEYQVTRGRREVHAPEAFAALRAVLDLCDSVNVPGTTVFHVRTDAVKNAITTALEGSTRRSPADERTRG